jgi:hypothetical protein
MQRATSCRRGLPSFVHYRSVLRATGCLQTTEGIFQISLKSELPHQANREMSTQMPKTLMSSKFQSLNRDLRYHHQSCAGSPLGLAS